MLAVGGLSGMRQPPPKRENVRARADLQFDHPSSLHTQAVGPRHLRQHAVRRVAQTVSDVLIAGCGARASPDNTHTDPPPSFSLSEDFTIHGLWPNRVDGSWPQYCNDTARFAPKAVDSIRPQLKEAWPSFGDGGDVGFWRHEWLRHGTCAGGDMAKNETAYFATALALNDKLPLLPALKDAGIVPSNTVSRPHSVVVAALKKGLGVTPAVHCGSGKGRSKVTEVWVCVDKDGETPIDCPPVIKSKKGPGGSQQGKGACSNITLPTIKGAPGKSGGNGGQAANGGGSSEPKSGWGGLDGDARG